MVLDGRGGEFLTPDPRFPRQREPVVAPQDHILRWAEGAPPGMMQGNGPADIPPGGMGNGPADVPPGGGSAPPLEGQDFIGRPELERWPQRAGASLVLLGPRPAGE